MIPIYKMIATQVIQELECAGCKVDCQDNGFAFDRAIFKLGINVEALPSLKEADS